MAGLGAWIHHTRGRNGLGANDPGTQFRTMMWEDGLRLIGQHPLVRRWHGDHSQSLEEWNIRAFTYFHDESHFHSDLMQIAVERGLPAWRRGYGSVGYLISAARLIRRAQKHSRFATGVAAGSLAVSWPFKLRRWFITTWESSRRHDSVLLLRSSDCPGPHAGRAGGDRRAVGYSLQQVRPGEIGSDVAHGPRAVRYPVCSKLLISVETFARIITGTSYTSTSRAATQDARPIRWWIPSLLLAMFALQSLWFIGTQSFTYDEPGHILAGLDAWQHGRFEMWTDHPPLGRFWLTLPLARSQVEITQEPLARGYRVTAMQPGPEWLAWQTRRMNTLLGLALGVALWFAARRLFSAGAANVALALFAFTPSLIAHFSVATTDGIGALFVFLAACQIVLWRRNPSRGQTVLLGVVLGGLLLAKLSTPPEFLLALVLMLVLRRGEGLNGLGELNWRPMLAALGVALFVFWAGYLFHVSHLKVGDGQVVATFPNRDTKTWATKSNLHLKLSLPAGEYIEGFREVALSNRRGRPSWFLGEIYPKGGSRLYYPVAISSSGLRFFC